MREPGGNNAETLTDRGFGIALLSQSGSRGLDALGADDRSVAVGVGVEVELPAAGEQRDRIDRDVVAPVLAPVSPHARRDLLGPDDAVLQGLALVVDLDDRARPELVERPEHRWAAVVIAVCVGNVSVHIYVAAEDGIAA